MRVSKAVGSVAAAAILMASTAARAEPSPAAAPPQGASEPAGAPAPPAVGSTTPPADPHRLGPVPVTVVQPTTPVLTTTPSGVSTLVVQGDPNDHRPFKVDPVTDVAIIGLSLGFGGINELIISTGEIRPQRPVNAGALLGIDSGAVTQTIDTGAGSRSNLGLYAALAFALVDPLLSGLRDGGDAAVVDATLYAETLSLTFALTDLAKVAVRRPRPSAYVAQARLDGIYGADSSPSISDTDQSLSFFSGHASICAATSATATYLAFTRAPGTWRPWVTLVAGTLVTSGVAYERVRAGAHFPTDVIAGALAGAGMGIIVPHLHRRSPDGSASWIGLNPVPAGLGLGWQGIF